jgi:hypothetical protein
LRFENSVLRIPEFRTILFTFPQNIQAVACHPFLSNHDFSFNAQPDKKIIDGGLKRVERIFVSHLLVRVAEASVKAPTGVDRIYSVGKEVWIINRTGGSSKIEDLPQELIRLNTDIMVCPPLRSDFILHRFLILRRDQEAYQQEWK